MENIKSLSWILSDYIWKVLMHILPTKFYLTLKYRVIFGKWIDWLTPQTYSEKLQWLKVYGYKPEYSDYVDKIKVKKYVASIIGEKFIIPTLGVWSSAKDIDFPSLPKKFVLKCNHDSGKVLVCKDKSTLDIEKTRTIMTKYLKYNYYLQGRELPYKYVEKKIFAEQFIQDNLTGELRDYKFYCFNGVPKMLLVATDREADVKFDFFDIDFNHLDLKRGHENAEKHITVPRNFELMKSIATKLSAGIPHVRIDLYEANGNVYFGEMTFYPSSGFTPFQPNSWEYKLGSWINLPNKTCNA